MYERNKNEAEFLFIYIREAHPSDSSWADHEVDVADPKSLEERRKVAGTCTSELDLSMPAVVDEIDDRVSMRYGGWPERIVVIDREGKITYRSKIGPWGFKPKEAEKALRELLR